MCTFLSLLQKLVRNLTKHTHTHSPPNYSFPHTHTASILFSNQTPFTSQYFCNSFLLRPPATPYYNPLYLHIKPGKASACFIVKSALAHVTAYVISRVNLHILKAHVRPVREEHQGGRRRKEGTTMTTTFVNGGTENRSGAAGIAIS